MQTGFIFDWCNIIVTGAGTRNGCHGCHITEQWCIFDTYLKNYAYDSNLFCCSMVPVDLYKDFTLRWRHNRHDGVSNHQPHDCLLNRLLFRRRSKKTSKLRVTGLCAGNSLVTGEFTAQKASSAENVSIWWRHHDMGRKALKSLDFRLLKIYSTRYLHFVIILLDKSPWL